MDNNGSSNTMRIAIIVFVAAILALFLNSAIWWALDENREAGRGEFLLGHGQYADAEAALALALDKHPSDGKIRCDIGEAQLRGNKQNAALGTFAELFQIDPRSQYATRVRDLLGLFVRLPLSQKYVDALVLVSPNGKGALVVRGTPLTPSPLLGDDPNNTPEMRIDPEKIELVYVDAAGKEEKKLAMFSDFPAIITHLPVWAPDGSGLALMGNPKTTPDMPPAPLGVYWLAVEGESKGPVAVYTPNDPVNDIAINDIAPGAGGKKFALLVRIEPRVAPVATPQPPVSDPSTKVAPMAQPTAPRDTTAPPAPPAPPRYEIWVVEPGKAPTSVLKLGLHQELAQLGWAGDKLLALITERKESSRTLLAEIDISSKKTETVGIKNAVYSSFIPSPDNSKLALLTADTDQNGDGVINDKDRHHLAILNLAANTIVDLAEFPPDLDPLVLLQWASNNRILAYANCWGGERLLVFSGEGRFLSSPANAMLTDGLTGIRLVEGGRKAMLLDTTNDWNGDGILNTMDGRVSTIELDKSADPGYVAAMVRHLKDLAGSKNK
jgi:hypothetical protein